MALPLDQLLPLLQCPGSGESLFECMQPHGLTSGASGSIYPFVNSVPVFHELGAAVSIVPAGHVSNPLAPAAHELLSARNSLALNIGAGASAEKMEHVIEFEYQVFSTTDVVGDAHCLPFKDDIFDVVCAMNVFEHLYAPHRAASEIHRVLKPGGTVLIHTAFLQPLHEPPHHYYNATEFGVRKWFEQFDLDHCMVSSNFSPAYSLGMISHALCHHAKGSMSPELFEILRYTTLQDWSDFWACPEPNPEGTPVQRAAAALGTMNDFTRSICSAGFELLAHKRSSA